MKFRRIGIGEYKSLCGRVFIKRFRNASSCRQWRVTVCVDGVSGEPTHYATYAECKGHAERVLTHETLHAQTAQQPAIRAIKYLTVQRKRSTCGVQYDIVLHKPLDDIHEPLVRGCGVNRLPLALRNQGGTWAVLPKGELRISEAIAIVGTRAAAQLIADGLADPCAVRDVGGLEIG